MYKLQNRKDPHFPTLQKNVTRWMLILQFKVFDAMLSFLTAGFDYKKLLHLSHLLLNVGLILNKINVIQLNFFIHFLKFIMSPKTSLP